MADQTASLPAPHEEPAAPGALPAAAGEVAAPVKRLVRDFLSYVGEVSVMLGQGVQFVAKGQVDIRDLLQQMALIGFNSIPIAMLTSLMSGMVISLYFTPFLQQYGQGPLSGGFVTLSLARELVPVLTGVVVAARAGSTIAAELGTMKVSEQIDALRALAVSPVQYLVVPRVIASVVMLPVVCAIADAVGVMGGYIITNYYGVPASTFPASLRQIVEPRDFYMGLVKTLVFGLILSTVGCREGLNTEGGATEVGRATTNAVVISIVLIYISNFFLAAVMFPRTVTF